MKRKIEIIIKNGSEEGREYVLEDVLTLGRDKKSDIVFNDDTVSRFHAKVFMEGDVPVIVDLDSINSTFVNGQEIKHIQLRDKDEVSIGDTTLQIKIEKKEEAWAEEKKEPVEEGEAETGKNFVPQVKNIVSVVIILFLALLVIGLAVWATINIFSDRRKANSAKSAAKLKYEIRYVKGEATKKNIYRYEFIIKPFKDKYRIVAHIDDIIQGKHIDESEVVNKEDVKELIKDIPENIFFQLKQKYFVPDPERYSFVSIDLTIGKDTKKVEAINTPPPPVFNEIQEALEDFAERKMSLITLTLSGDELRDLANKNYSLAKTNFDSRNVNPGNLYDSVVLCRKALTYLDSITPKPPIYRRVNSLLKDARRYLNEEYEEVIKRVKINIKQQQWEEAAKDLEYIFALIPDTTDPRYKKAQGRMGFVESKLKKRRRY
jgi:pSer/pThr/pTyr-binding forkhead associated (FHA) protein